MLSAEGGVIRGIKVSTARVEDRRPTQHARFAASRTAARLLHTPFSLSVLPLLASLSVLPLLASLSVLPLLASLSVLPLLALLQVWHVMPS